MINIHKCFTSEELDNLLFMIITYRNIQNGGKIIWGGIPPGSAVPELRTLFLRPRLTESLILRGHPSHVRVYLFAE